MVSDILQIKGSDVSHLQDDLHMGFWTEMGKRLRAYRNGADGNAKNFPAKVDAEFTPWITAVASEDELYKTVTKSQLTKPIKEKDTERDGLYREIKRTVDTFATLSILPEKQAAALKMQPVMQKYKIDPSASYEAETVAIAQWLQEQERNYQLELAAKELGILESVRSLRTLNDEVRTLISQRNDERSAQVVAALREARKVSDQTWRNLVLILNAAALMDEDEYRYTELLQGINEELKYFKRVSEQRRKANARKKDGGDEAGEDENTVPTEPETPASEEQQKYE